MRYCTLDDLLLAIPRHTLAQLSNDDPSFAATEINLVVVERAVSQAEEKVDGALRSRYVTPLSTVPTVVREIVVNLARHWLYARRPEGHDFPEAVSRTYKEAQRDIEAIQSGSLTLGLPTGQNAPEPGEFKVRSRAPRFTNDLLDKY